MFLFAFPGMGKTTLAKKYETVVDLEMSDIKYDNSSVSHLSREERKSTKRPIKDRNYKQTYIDRAYDLHEKGKIVLVALNFLFPILRAFRERKPVPFHIFVPHPSLRSEYRQRYLGRGNNGRFIFEVMTIWYPTLVPLWLLSKILPKWITVTKTGETLEDYYIQHFYQTEIRIKKLIVE
ncbi:MULTISPECIES: hypothetical protein [unclassified Streptococcus]|uniref:hypothetical protein n=1 Tax=unclassified Streptococcus TaxID=2608887 RepID=UPI0018A9EED1|nr:MULTISPECIES: hypothetical protein [unclassified Streptococcus]MBF8969951.1 hypothetical protein [Streptococcus sp. NLN76]MBG9367133.1 hypothetical protein [Streptococcus sp. NLN64]